MRSCPGRAMHAQVHLVAVLQCLEESSDACQTQPAHCSTNELMQSHCQEHETHLQALKLTILAVVQNFNRAVFALLYSCPQAGYCLTACILALQSSSRPA